MDLLQQLDITHPIFLAPMAGVSTPELAAAVSKAGGLGALGLGADSLARAKKEIARTQQLTDKAFQVNFFCHQPEEYNAMAAKQWINYLHPQLEQFGLHVEQPLKKIYPSFIENDDYLNLVLEMKPKAISFHFGLPNEQHIQALKQANIVTMVSVSQLSEALLAQRMGIDILIAQGIEAGGHRAMFNPKYEPGLSTVDLVLLLQQYIDLPIVAAGGVMTGKDIQFYLDIGASAVQLGTAFVQCKESAANKYYKQALFEQPITQISSSISGRPARGLINHWHLSVDKSERPEHAGYPFSYDLGKQLNIAALEQVEEGFGAFWAGANVAHIRRMDADQLIQTLIEEMIVL